MLKFLMYKCISYVENISMKSVHLILYFKLFLDHTVERLHILLSYHTVLGTMMRKNVCTGPLQATLFEYFL